MRRAFAVLFVGLLAIFGLGWAVSAPRPRFSETEWRGIASQGDAAAGRSVFFAAGCDSCHASPNQPDPLRLAGGLELKTPFGSFFPPNISSDRGDGLGDWRDVDIANALLSGVSRDGRNLYPAFPYTSYGRMKIADVADLIAFLRALPALAGRPPAQRLKFPFSVRRLVGLWKLMFFREDGVRPDSARDAQWNLGRYLVVGPGHCGECHTPRGILGEMASDRFLAGAPMLDGRGRAPSLIAGEVAKWTKDDLVEALTDGFTPTGDVLGGAMTAVVGNLARLPAADREAIAAYLKSLSAPGARAGAL